MKYVGKKYSIIILGMIEGYLFVFFHTHDILLRDETTLKIGCEKSSKRSGGTVTFVTNPGSSFNENN